MLNTTMRICAQTLPLAARTKDVTPMRAAASVIRSGSGEVRLEMSTRVKEAIQRIHSFRVKVLMGFCMGSLLLK